MPAEHESAAPATPWSQTLNHLLWKASQAMHRTLNSELNQLGLTVNQLGLAVTLAQRAPLSAADLARSHSLTPQTVNIALSHVDQLGWLDRTPHPVHKRVVLLELTEKGRAGVEKGRAITDGVVARISDVLGGPAETRVFVGALQRIADELDGPDVPLARTWPEKSRD